MGRCRRGKQIAAYSKESVPRLKLDFPPALKRVFSVETFHRALNPDFLYAAQDTTGYAAFVKESRKKGAGATKLHRKSGEALFPPHKCGGSHRRNYTIL
jgi:hypothetical protein